MRAWRGATLGALGAAAIACGTSTTGGPADGGADGGVTDLDAATADADGAAPVVTPSDAAKAAIFYASCTSDDGVNRTLQEIYLDRGESVLRLLQPSIVACLGTKSNGCKAVTECAGISYEQLAGCAARCDGKTAEYCSGSVHVRIDCAKLGLECVVGARLPTCVATTTPCDPQTYASVCEGDRPTMCYDGFKDVGRPCADIGLTCGGTDAGSGVGRCRGSLGACNAVIDGRLGATYTPVACEGGKLKGCVNAGLALFDCAQAAPGFTCQTAAGPGGAPAYCGTATECAPPDPWTKQPASCDGTSVVFCNGGKIEKVDCRSLGFARCDNGQCSPGFL
jgi:hypothetical protein